MSGPQIRLTGHIDVPADRVAAIAAALPGHVLLTRAEPGCISFEVTPDADVPGRYRVAELFESRAAYDAHQARTAASAWGRISLDLERSYEIREFAP